MEKKTIAITMGDPGGIGPEVVVKALQDERVRSSVTPVIVGDGGVIRDAADLTGTGIGLEEDLSRPVSGNSAYFIDINERSGFPRSAPSAEGGNASVSCIRTAVELCLEGKAHAMVTAPISKQALRLAGHYWPGHTEMISELTGARKTAMMFSGPVLKVILVTIHVPLRSVPALITEEKVYNTLCLAEKACDMLSIDTPRIGVAGLNPHSGEGGLFGSSESKNIEPAIRRAAKEGFNVSGPYPPDIIFKKASDGDLDIVVAMYHDQGLIPFKLIHFDTGVNCTIGLPIIRTSPDHGTAYDIAWKGTANPASMIEAILLAERMNI